jgi:release factor glutamine methyltransferase
MTVQQAYQQLLFQLYEIYDDREAANIADLVIENITGFRKIDRILNKQFPLNEKQPRQLQNFTSELLQHKPVQYVLHEAWFAGMKFYVDENVLIPRPETEELINWIIEDLPLTTRHLTLTTHNSLLTILDVGTGSGCIPIALKKKLSSPEIEAIDLSEQALNVAKQNAQTHNAKIKFKLVDILAKDSWQSLPMYDVIVSNPPYVKKSEASAMHAHVVEHEPHLALFVPDEDPLIFYKAIAQFGLMHLNKNGKLFFEINESFGAEVTQLLQQNGYINVEQKKDMQGKDRMIKAAIK